MKAATRNVLWFTQGAVFSHLVCVDIVHLFLRDKTIVPPNGDQVTGLLRNCLPFVPYDLC